MQIHRTRRRPLLGAAGLSSAFALTAALAVASSHREAPFITELPKVDGTDFYMFTSYEPGREGYVTFAADYLPLQDPYGGPDYFSMDPQARYEIHVDRDGDAVEDLTFRFTFENLLQDIALPVGPAGNQKMISVPLKNVGPITVGNNSNLNVIETYRLELVMGSGPSAAAVTIVNAATGEDTFIKPVDNIGNKSLPAYAAYAAQYLYDILLPDGSVGRLFVGQRDDPFVVNLGDTFDLVNTNPLGPINGEQDDLAGKNVTSFLLELPKSFLVQPGQPVIGGWTTASLHKERVLSKNPSFAMPALEVGEFIQVSRLGSPLVNEVVIGLKDKDRFNASHPADDAQFADYVTNPTLPELLEALFPVTAPNQFPRTDLVQAFVTGIPGLNDNGAFGEMLRLNTETPPTPAAQQDRMGVIGGDPAGFPNGRRPGDDVVDIALRVVMGVLLPMDVAPSGQLPFTDGAFVDASAFFTRWPYLETPFPGAP